MSRRFRARATFEVTIDLTEDEIAERLGEDDLDDDEALIESLEADYDSPSAFDETGYTLIESSVEAIEE